MSKPFITYTAQVEKLKNADTPSMITVSEQTRRMSEMMEMYGMSNSSTGKKSSYYR